MPRRPSRMTTDLLREVGSSQVQWQAGVAGRQVLGAGSRLAALRCSGRQAWQAGSS